MLQDSMNKQSSGLEDAVVEAISKQHSPTLPSCSMRNPLNFENAASA